MRRIAILLVLAACAPEAPEHPTWADVQPILTANCVRCHGRNPQGGAPATFRLDVHGDGFDVASDIYYPRRGAAAMAEFIVARVRRTDGRQMPPHAPLSARQQKILTRWWLDAVAADALPTGEVPDNQPPTITAELPTVPADQQLVFEVVIDDPDHQPVIGQIGYGVGLVTDGLHGGRQTVVWDTGIVPPGTYSLTAFVDDGNVLIDQVLGEVTIQHAFGNTSPQLLWVSPSHHPGSLYGDSAQIEFFVGDPEDNLDVQLEAFRGDTVEDLPNLTNVPSGLVTLPWDTSTIPAGNWRLRALVRDNVGPDRIYESPPFVIGHDTTSETWDTGIGTLFADHCVPCHFGAETLVPGLENLDWNDPDSVRENAGIIYQKVVVRMEMPPPSAEVIWDPPIETLTLDERDRIRRWLEAGAPR